jgi:hypothetical protein
MNELYTTVRVEPSPAVAIHASDGDKGHAFLDRDVPARQSPSAPSKA